MGWKKLAPGRAEKRRREEERREEESRVEWRGGEGKGRHVLNCSGSRWTNS